MPFSANQLFASAPGVFLVGSGVQGLAAPVFLQLSSPGTIRIGDATYAPLGMTIGGGVSRPGGGDLSGVSPRRAFRPRATLRMSELLLRVSSSNLQGVVAHGLIAVPTESSATLAHAAMSRASSRAADVTRYWVFACSRGGYCPSKETHMLTKTAIGFAVVALALAAAAFQPASANYAPCVENPEGAGCPGALTPIKPQGSVRPAPSRHAMHAHNYRAHRPATSAY